MPLSDTPPSPAVIRSRRVVLPVDYARGGSGW